MNNVGKKKHESIDFAEKYPRKIVYGDSYLFFSELEGSFHETIWHSFITSFSAGLVSIVLDGPSLATDNRINARER